MDDLGGEAMGRNEAGAYEVSDPSEWIDSDNSLEVSDHSPIRKKCKARPKTKKSVPSPRTQTRPKGKKTRRGRKTQQTKTKKTQKKTIKPQQNNKRQQLTRKSRNK